MFGFIKKISTGLTVLSRLVSTTTLSRKNENKCSFCILYIVWIVINAWIVITKMLLNMILSIKQKVININGKSKTNKYQKSNSLFLPWHYQSQRFWVEIVKNWQKIIQKHFYLQLWIYYNKKNWWLWKYLQCESFVFTY